MPAYLIVRAQVDPSVHDAFDTWYESEHLPDAHAAFRPISAKRGWSELESDVHVAIYEFKDLTAVKAVMASQKIKDLIAEFDRHWEGKVTRTREVLPLKQMI